MGRCWQHFTFWRRQPKSCRRNDKSLLARGDDEALSVLASSRPLIIFGKPVGVGRYAIRHLRKCIIVHLSFQAYVCVSGNDDGCEAEDSEAIVILHWRVC